MFHVMLTAGILSVASTGFAQGPDKARVDPLGDPLPKGAITRIGTTRLCNQGGATGLAFAPDGKSVASENGSGVVRLWDVATGKEIRAMKPPVAGYGPLAFAPDGKTIASTAGAYLVCVWEADTGRLMRRLEAKSQIRSLAYAANSLLLAAGTDQGIVLWEAGTGKMLHTLKGHREGPNGLAFTADNKTLVSTGHDGTTRVWDLAAGKETHKFAPNPLSNSSLVLAAKDSVAISAGGMNSDGILRYWDLTQKQQFRQIQAHKAGALCMAISKNGKLLVSGGYDRFIRFWDAETTAELGSLPEQPGPVTHVAVSPAGDLVAWGAGSRVRIARIDAPPKPFQVKELFPHHGHDSGIGAISFSADGKKLLSQAGGVAILWDELTGKELHRFQKGWRHAWSADGKLIAFADPNDNTDRAIYLFDPDTGKEVRRLSASTQVMTHAFARDRASILIGGSDQAVHLVEVATGKPRLTMASKMGSPWRVVPAPDGLTVAAVRQKEVHIYDLITGAELASVPASGQGALFSPDGSLLACRTYQDILLWDLVNNKKLRTIPARAFDIAFLPDGQTLAASCMDETIRLWDVTTGKELHTFVGHSGWIMSIAITPDGRTLVSGSADTTMLLWPLDRFVKGKPLAAPRLAEKELKARLAKLPEGKIDTAWSALMDADASKAYHGIWTLVRAPAAALPILRKWVGPICATPIATLIEDLAHPEEKRRETATLNLERLGRLARPALQAALAGKLEAEPRRRIERMLALSEVDVNAGYDDGLRLLRSVEVLEHIGSAEAAELLGLIAKQAPMPDAAAQAQAALRRLAR